MGSLIFLLLSFWNLHAQTGCHHTEVGSISTLTCPRVSVEQTAIQGAFRMVVVFTDGFRLELRVVNQKKLKQLLVTPSLRKQWQLSVQDYNEIQEAARFFQDNHLEKNYFLIEFFKNLPKGEALNPLVSRSDEIPWPYTSPVFKAQFWDDSGGGYTMLCEEVGTEWDAMYRVLDVDIIKTVIIGQPETDCYGRCGFGCGTPTYTQECLNHDACHRDTGENLGVCADYFWAAADGYLWAPPCDI